VYAFFKFCIFMRTAGLDFRDMVAEPMRTAFRLVGRASFLF
jgi:hypothetical protein